MSCPDCKRGTILLGEPTGAFTDLAGAYLAPAPEATAKRAILLLTDVFGLPLVNCRLIADTLARRLSCDVWVPDQFDGVPIFSVNQVEIPALSGLKRSRIKFFVSILPSIPQLIRSRFSVVENRPASFIEKIQAEKHYGNSGQWDFALVEQWQEGWVKRTVSRASLFATLAHLASLTWSPLRFPYRGCVLKRTTVSLPQSETSSRHRWQREKGRAISSIMNSMIIRTLFMDSQCVLTYRSEKSRTLSRNHKTRWSIGSIRPSPLDPSTAVLAATCQRNTL